ncbi:MAG: adenylate kinase family protein [Candidatus Odinarchaeota archaeon]
MINIIISGTPGCGKTSVAKEITNFLQANIISLSELAISNEFRFNYDEKRKTYIVDFEIFLPYLLKRIDEINQTDLPYLIIESHFSDIIPEKLIDYAFILRCDPDELYKRLEKRNYTLEKIIENVQAEILGNCVNYFLQKKTKFPLFEINATDLSINSIAKIIVDIVLGAENGSKYLIGNIDWLEKLFQENRLEEYFD